MTEKTDILYGALISVARASESNPLCMDSTYDILAGGLAAADACVRHTEEQEKGAGGPARLWNEERSASLADRWTELARAEKHRLVPRCASCANPCGRTEEYDLKEADRTEAPGLVKEKRRLLRELGEFAAFLSAERAEAPEETGMAYQTHIKMSDMPRQQDMVPRLFLTPELEGFFAWALFEVGYEDSEDGLKEVFDTLSKMKQDTL